MRCDIHCLTTRFWFWALDLPHKEDPESGLGGSGTLRLRQRLRLRKTFEAQGQQAARGEEGAMHSVLAGDH